MATEDLKKRRDELRSYFERGKMPTADHFRALIDSTVNRIDDGFSREPDFGLKLAAHDDDEFRQLVSFYKDIGSLNGIPSWFLELRKEPNESFGLSFSEPDYATAKNHSRLYIQPQKLDDTGNYVAGNVGIGTTTPVEKLDVKGFVASQGRTGTYPTSSPVPNEVPADGLWHPIVMELTGLHIFEVVSAAYGPQKKGHYSLGHAIAMSAYGNSRNRICNQTAWYRGWFQRIQLRWTGSTMNYNLEIRTKSNFGDGSRIVYTITSLLNDKMATHHL